MIWTDKTLSIQTDAPKPGCHACQQSESGSACGGVKPPSALQPRLVGLPDELQRLLAALAPRWGFDLQPGTAAGAGLVRGLAVSPGEVTLELAPGRQCGGQGMIDTAFQTLRMLLPDTDIYVTHAD